MKPGVELSGQDWKTVDTMARDLARDVDRNELGKAVAYFRRTRSKGKFLELLKRLPSSDYIRRSNRTQQYFRRTEQACRQHLAAAGDEKALAIVTWAFRLMAFYQSENEQRFGGSRR
ncbi:MAG TPA: hypothetical protein VJL59_15565 [Anaerolineales bacterium]|nr:hypothetical protein [Anaerolineales bacterium]